MVFDRLVPPLNFSYVETGLVRSGQPSEINLPFLSGLSLKTIVWLAVEEPNEPLLRFAAENELTIHHLGIVEDGNPWDPLTELCVVDALRHIIDSRNHPLLICCGMGRHRTGTVVGCLRILQGWNLASALEEYRRYTGQRRSRVVNELQIESFRKESIPLPPESVMAPWLWVAQMHLQELRRDEAKRAEAGTADAAPKAVETNVEGEKSLKEEE